MLENLSAPGAYKDLANLVGKEFRTYLDNVLTIFFIIEVSISNKCPNDDDDVYLNDVSIF